MPGGGGGGGGGCGSPRNRLAEVVRGVVVRSDVAIWARALDGVLERDTMLYIASGMKEEIDIASTSIYPEDVRIRPGATS